MKISSQTAGQPAAVRKNPPAPTAHKPYQDWWQVGEERYESTADLVQNLQVDADGTPATYRFTEGPPPEKESALYAGLAGAAGGAATGALAAGALGVMGEILNVIGTIITLGRGGQASPILTGTFLATAAGIGAVAGAGLGLAAHFKADTSPEALAASRPGTVRKEFGPDGSATTKFYVGGDLNRPVDLQAYAQASELPAPQLPDESESRKNHALNGALAGGSAALPLVGLLAPTVAGANLGAAADKGKLRGALIGGALGLGATVGTYAAGSAFGVAGWLGAAAGAAAVGAGLGALLGPQIDANSTPSPARAQQWWAQG